MPIGDAMTFLTDEPWENGTEYVFGALPLKRKTAMSSKVLKSDKLSPETVRPVDYDKDAQRISVRMEVAAHMLKHAHTIDLDHLKDVSTFVLTGRLPKTKVNENGA